MYKLIITDLDDTLYEHSKTIIKAYSKVAKILIDYGIEPLAFYESIQNERIKGFSKFNDLNWEIDNYEISKIEIDYLFIPQNIIRKVLLNFNIDLTSEVEFIINDLFWNTFFDNISLYSGVYDTLKILKKQGYLIAITSDGILDEKLKVLRKLGIDNMIDYIMTTDKSRQLKPGKLNILKILSDLNIQKENTLFIGNHFSDYTTAINCDIDFVGFNCSGCWEFNPMYKISEFNDILKFIIQ
ncbi:MAG: HAD family hydrolase [Paraclostridium sp.]